MLTRPKEIDILIGKFNTLGVAGTDAGAALLLAWQTGKAFAEQGAADAGAALDDYNKKTDDLRKKLFLNINGAAPKGDKDKKGGKSAADKAREQAQALREVEMTLAKMTGDLEKVAELEGLEKLDRFTELLKKAGIAGNEAAGYIEKFKEAQGKEVRTEHLQEQLQFYKDLRAIMPAAGAEYAKIREELLALEEAQLRAIGISEEFLAVWREQMELREATDFISGLKLGVQEFTGSLTAAKGAQDLVSTAIGASTDAMTDFFTGAKTAGEAWEDFGDTVIKQLTRMITELYIMKPLMEGLAGMFGAGAGGGGLLSFLGFADGGVFNAPGLNAHLNKIVTKPTVFPFAKGGSIGLMGEAGAEAVMPLHRSSSGELGVTLDSEAFSLMREAVQAMNDKAVNQIRSNSNSTPAQVNIEIVNQSGEPVKAKDAQASTGKNGELNIKMIIDQVDDGLAAKESRGSSRFGSTIRSKSGLNPNATLHRGRGA